MLNTKIYFIGINKQFVCNSNSQGEEILLKAHYKNNITLNANATFTAYTTDGNTFVFGCNNLTTPGAGNLSKKLFDSSKISYYGFIFYNSNTNVIYINKSYFFYVNLYSELIYYLLSNHYV